MEDSTPRRGGAGEAPMGNLSSPLASLGLSSEHRAVPHRSAAQRLAGYCRRGLGALLVVGLLGARAVAQTPANAHSSTTYTGSPFNFCLPGYDSYDYQECWDYNWAVLNSSYSSIATINPALGASTQALAVNISTETAARIAADALKVDKNAPDQINLSTVTAALALKQDAFTGVSSTCASGYYWEGGTLANGVATGGRCVQIIASQGHILGVSSNTSSPETYYTQRGTMTYDSRFFNLTDAGGDYGTFVSMTTAPVVSSSTAHMASVVGIVATAWDGCNITDSTVTFTTTGIGDRALVIHNAMVTNSLTGADSYLRVLLDGAPMSDAHATAPSVAAGANSNADLNASFVRLTPALSSGTHTMCLGMWVSAGTGRYSRDIGGTYIDNFFGAFEITGSAVGSGSGSGTDSTKLPLAGGTMTGAIIMSGTNITLTGSGGYITSASSGNFSGLFGPLVGNVTGNLTGNVTGNVTGALTGNADTATALAANPADCGAGEYASAIAANGNLTCSTPSGAGEANTFTSSKTFTNVVEASSFTTTNTSTYAITSSSGIWMKAGMFRLPDNSVIYSTGQFSPAESSSQTAITANSASINGNNTFASATNECAAAISTLTYTINGTVLDVEVNVSVKGGVATSHSCLGMLLDGALLSGQTTATCVTRVYQPTSASIGNHSFRRRIKGLTPGSHTACLFFRASSTNTSAIDNADGTFTISEGH